MEPLVRALTESEAKHIRELLRSATTRREHRQFVIEGAHLLEVALDERADLEFVAFTEQARSAHSSLFDRTAAAECSLRSIPAKHSRRISDTEAPQGIFAVVRIGPPAVPDGRIVLALDAVQDPGNVGTLLRTAAWFGVTDVLLGEGSADAYNPKVVRSTQGAIFTVHVHDRVDLPQTIAEMTGRGYTAVATLLDASATPISQFTRADRIILVLGNEAHGISQAVQSACDQRVFIPRFGTGESLNAAVSGAIALHELTRTRS